MAAARQRAEWLRIGIAVSWIINRNGWTKEPVNPLSIIPPQFHPEEAARREKSPDEVASQSKRAWSVLDRFFGGP